MIRYNVIVNKKSSGANSFLRHVAKKAYFDVTIHAVEPSELESVFLKIISESHSDSYLLVAGGDGTLSHLFKYIVFRPNHIRIGVIPVGSVNLFASSIGLIENPLELLEMRHNFKPIQANVGTCNGRVFLTALSLDENAIYLINARERAREKFFLKSIFYLLNLVSRLYLANSTAFSSAIKWQMGKRKGELSGKLLFISPATLEPLPVNCTSILRGGVAGFLKKNLNLVNNRRGLVLYSIDAGFRNILAMGKLSISGTWTAHSSVKIVKLSRRALDNFPLQLPYQERVILDGESLEVPISKLLNCSYDSICIWGVSKHT